MDVHEQEQRWSARGCSLVGLLMVIMLLGLLSATAIVGVSSMTGGSGGTSVVNGSGAGGGVNSALDKSTLTACRATADAARSASALYFLSNGNTSYPTKWSDMTDLKLQTYAPGADVVINARNPKELDGRGWKLIMSGGGANELTFTCGR